MPAIKRVLKQLLNNRHNQPFITKNFFRNFSGYIQIDHWALPALGNLDSGTYRFINRFLQAAWAVAECGEKAANLRLPAYGWLREEDTVPPADEPSGFVDSGQRVLGVIDKLTTST